MVCTAGVQCASPHFIPMAGRHPAAGGAGGATAAAFASSGGADTGLPLTSTPVNSNPTAFLKSVAFLAWSTRTFRMTTSRMGISVRPSTYSAVPET